MAVLLGLFGVGAASGTALLARTAAGDMYPPERRAHGIALVLFGAVFGAILGPAVFSPLISGHDLDGHGLAMLWSAGAGSRSPRWRSWSPCAPTRAGSPSCWPRRIRRRTSPSTIAARRRCASSCGAPA